MGKRESERLARRDRDMKVKKREEWETKRLRRRDGAVQVKGSEIRENIV